MNFKYVGSWLFNSEARLEFFEYECFLHNVKITIEKSGLLILEGSKTDVLYITDNYISYFEE